MSDEPSIRLDLWLDVACICRTRSQAQRACKLGRVTVNGDRGKPHRLVRPGDRITVSFTGGWRRIIEVVDIATGNVSRARARELYIDHTPKPTEEEMELRRMLRFAAPPTRPRGAGAPKKKERRDLRRAKEGWEDG